MQDEFETVETVSELEQSSNTRLKPGVNEITFGQSHIGIARDLGATLVRTGQLWIWSLRVLTLRLDAAPPT